MRGAERRDAASVTGERGHAVFFAGSRDVEPESPTRAPDNHAHGSSDLAPVSSATSTGTEVSMERLNEAMSFIERHLEGDVDIRRASRIATMSEHHFRRVFSTLAGCRSRSMCAVDG